MQWENNGGNQGPWGKGPSGGNKKPNKPTNGGKKPDQNEFDLDEWLSNLSKKIGSHFGGGKKGGTNWPSIVILIAVLAVAWLASGFYTIAEEQQGVVMRFGAYHRQTDPGLHIHAPYPFEKVIKVPVQRVNKVEVGLRSDSRGRSERDLKIEKESLMLTGDENIVDIDFEVQWKIDNAQKFLFNVREPDETVKTVAESAMREVIARTKLTSALTEGRLSIEQDVQEIIQNTLAEYDSGISILRVLLREVQPPAAVIDAFRDVQTARADMERLRNEAEAYRNEIVPKAQGRASQILNEAEGYKQQVVARAEGEASRFSQVFEEYNKAKDVTRKRMYLETMEGILGGMNKIILDKNVGGSGVVPYLPLNQLQEKK